MKHVKVLGVALLLCLAALWLRGSAKIAITAENASAGETPSSVLRHGADPHEARLVEERIHQLESMDRRRRQSEAASANMIVFREQAQAEAAPRWKQVVADNREAYQALLAKALNSPHNETACTICDGMSYMPCVMCKGRDGKCVTCRGSGQSNQEALCPTCLGKGKCYLCAGSRKMFCPFCNDGMIEARGRPPSDSPPLQ